MREVNNNRTNSSNGVNFQGVQPRNSKEVVMPSIIESEEVTDLGKMPSEVIGRSQVSQSSLEKDMAYMAEHPEKVEDADKMFEYLVTKKGIPYEKAAEIATGTVKEFQL